MQHQQQPTTKSPYRHWQQQQHAHTYTYICMCLCMFVWPTIIATTSASDVEHSNKKNKCVEFTLTTSRRNNNTNNDNNREVCQPADKVACYTTATTWYCGIALPLKFRGTTKQENPLWPWMGERMNEWMDGWLTDTLHDCVGWTVRCIYSTHVYEKHALVLRKRWVTCGYMHFIKILVYKKMCFNLTSNKSYLFIYKQKY